ncbi:two-component system regulatory protein YycI [Gemella sp. zg-1178]|uniref:two-component system regulatory protein YycI n=1 Tax=Gemella sp. zg-1178 TaxID=2840372 RepID=UPI001C057D99|nr:two-component system regulatory protein YycI [Gemella sp. zg-1178]MBU0278156.1 two-component system regulatory protein YycI [Gemella sp. zg-1178]
MDWGKIKTLFIYLFLVFNLILISIYGYLVYKNRVVNYHEIEAIGASMKNDNITVKEVDNTKENLGYLSAVIKRVAEPDLSSKVGSYSYSFESKDGLEKLNIKLEKPLTNINSPNYKELLSSFVNADLTKNKTYVFDAYLPKERVVNFRQTYEGVVINSNKNALIQFEVEDDGNIYRLSQTAFTDFKKENTTNIASYSQVINKLYHENLIPRDSEVKATIGYYTYISNVKNQVLIPSWKVTISVKNKNIEKIYYVDAINIKILDKNE